MRPEEELAKRIDENSEMFERWKKTSEKISLDEFKEAIQAFRKETEESTELLGKDIPLDADKIAYNLVASRNAFSSVLLWGASLELYVKRLEKELKSLKPKTIKKKSKKR
ncbi:MAG: hypothetical protein XU09_C0001G0127 [Thaumarchaeota archaeon CSP1-1]|nr:MAG: hypothetical protein XU09_C0001G0127 [Thaumarchaeota archaeon CSP1-1]